MTPQNNKKLQSQNKKRPDKSLKKEAKKQDNSLHLNKQEKFSPGEYAGYNAEDYNTD